MVGNGELSPSKFNEPGVAPELSLFYCSGPSFCSFSHINIFSCLGVPQVEWKRN